jgi:hypothetical protein
MKLLGIGMWNTFKAQKVFKPLARHHDLQRQVFGYILKSSMTSRYDLKKIRKRTEFEPDNDPQTSDKCTFYLATISLIRYFEQA